MHQISPQTKLPAKMIHFSNSTSTITFSINKGNFKQAVITITQLAFLLGFSGILIYAYQVEPHFFWSLFKVGIVLILVLFSAFIAKTNTIKKTKGK